MLGAAAARSGAKAGQNFERVGSDDEDQYLNVGNSGRKLNI